MPQTKSLLQQAKRILQETPYDVAHDFSHHERVWENAQAIAKAIHENVNQEALQLACFWHDVTLGSKDQTEDRTQHIEETLEYLKKLMKEQSVDEILQKKVVQAIEQHEFTTRKQTSIEAKVLFDADKLDAFHKKRYTALLEAQKNKQFSKMKLFLMVQAAKLWLRTARNRYHFDISREMHDERIESLLKDKEAVRMAKELGVDIAELVG